MENVINNFYKSLGKSIEERKKKESLKLRRDDILENPKRVTDIIKGKHNIHHPYLIGKYEYEDLYCLFLSDDKETFFKNLKLARENRDEFYKKIGNNYDKMLWGHIDWDMMLQDTINAISQMDISTDLGKLFDETLIDDVSYAVIKYDELDPGCAVKWIPQEERADIRKKAIERVHLRCGHELFKQIFLEHFSGETLDKFDKQFLEFVKDYLEQKKPNQYSFGLQAYNLYKNISGFNAKWYLTENAQYGNADKEENTNKEESTDKEENTGEGKSTGEEENTREEENTGEEENTSEKKRTREEEEKVEVEKFLNDYIRDGYEYIKKLEKYQERFDSLEKLEIN